MNAYFITLLFVLVTAIANVQGAVYTVVQYEVGSECKGTPVQKDSYDADAILGSVKCNKDGPYRITVEITANQCEEVVYNESAENCELEPWGLFKFGHSFDDPEKLLCYHDYFTAECSGSVPSDSKDLTCLTSTDITAEPPESGLVACIEDCDVKPRTCDDMKIAMSEGCAKDCTETENEQLRWMAILGGWPTSGKMSKMDVDCSCTAGLPDVAAAGLTASLTNTSASDASIVLPDESASGATSAQLGFLALIAVLAGLAHRA
eukprot:gnl/TRDRNA2_/TRDRNA2_191192_c0_seq1.p1 gnl/TRDRNA2_/TRDRNA2_191192_c0~~gnl/TRDRNA2_/TRDRNA2_191192_c0_seq1.p1  ORF type:complete len:263 (+),score=46.95 gnl/TRDRNA2_/TRDRNA2_191192_c0_seq1:66-854(+)